MAITGLERRPRRHRVARVPRAVPGEPRAVEALLAAGWDPSRPRYYRGGIHDWATLGLPLTR